tara:strand:+ start:285671 stop:286009 length:339 start_codon:yes stop_codon:yes gene_type:complete
MSLQDSRRESFIDIAKRDRAKFYFVPYESLRNRISRGGDETVDALPVAIKEAILLCDGNSTIGIWLDPKLVAKHVEGTLDKKNAYIFSMGEIRVFGTNELNIKPEQIRRIDL